MAERLLTAKKYGSGRILSFLSLIEEYNVVARSTFVTISGIPSAQFHRKICVIYLGAEDSGKEDKKVNVGKAVTSSSSAPRPHTRDTLLPDPHCFCGKVWMRSPLSPTYVKIWIPCRKARFPPHARPAVGDTVEKQLATTHELANAAQQRMALNPSLAELSEEIADASAIIEKYLKENNLPPLSLCKDGPLDFPAATPKIQSARSRLRAASKRMHDLAVGPAEQIRTMTWQIHDLTSLHYLYAYDIAEHVPKDGTITFEELARKAGVDEGLCRRMVRYAMTYNVFCEPNKGFVEHTGPSIFLLEPFVKAMIWHATSDSFRTPSFQVEALKKWGPSQELTQTAWNVANNSSQTFFEHIFSNPENTQRFGGFMQSMMTTEGYNVRHLLSGFNWAKLPKGSTVIDVGGGTGHASVAVAKEFPELKFIVQDLQDMSNHPGVQIPPDRKKNISFMAHDFWTEQPVKGEAVYLIQHVLHNYPDKYAAKILAELVPALKPGSIVLIKDGIAPIPGTEPPEQERLLRMLDMHMNIFFQGKERELMDWKNLLAGVDPRLKLVNVVKPEGSLMSVLEVVFQS